LGLGPDRYLSQSVGSAYAVAAQAIPPAATAAATLSAAMVLVITEIDARPPGSAAGGFAGKPPATFADRHPEAVMTANIFAFAAVADRRVEECIVANSTTRRRRFGSVLVALVCGGLGPAGPGLAAAGAQALPAVAPLNGGPIPENHWCPGDDPRGGPGGPFVTSPPNWDWTVCHTFWIVPSGQGNVSPGIWEGDGPPAPAPQPWTPLPGL
jgi:hypothetical protein